jgi:hypothetical protein
MLKLCRQLGGVQMIRAILTRSFRAPLVTGGPAVLVGIAAVALPTLVRAAIDGAVTGCEFTPYLPFVLLSAILLGSWPAAIIAVASVATLGGLFIGPSASFLEKPCFVSGAGTFLGASAVVIGLVIAIRRVFAAIEKRGTDEGSGGVIFSLDRGQVWASWYGQGPPVLLGSQRRVGEMMKDFLAHEELAKRLNRNSD